jgi:hypothetical protein
MSRSAAPVRSVDGHAKTVEHLGLPVAKLDCHIFEADRRVERGRREGKSALLQKPPAFACKLKPVSRGRLKRRS